MMLSDVCLSNVWHLSVAYIGSRSRTERPRKTKIGTEVAHGTRDSDTTFKVKRSKVKVTRPLYLLRRLHIRQLQRWSWESIHRGNGNLLLRCRLQARRSARRSEALRCPEREQKGGGISWRPPAYSLLVYSTVFITSYWNSLLFRLWTSNNLKRLRDHKDHIINTLL